MLINLPDYNPILSWPMASEFQFQLSFSSLGTTFPQPFERASPLAIFDLSQLKCLAVDAVWVSKEPRDDDRQLSAGHFVCSILTGSHRTHMSIKAADACSVVVLIETTRTMLFLFHGLMDILNKCNRQITVTLTLTWHRCCFAVWWWFFSSKCFIIR